MLAPPSAAGTSGCVGSGFLLGLFGLGSSGLLGLYFLWRLGGLRACGWGTLTAHLDGASRNCTLGLLLGKIGLARLARLYAKLIELADVLESHSVLLFVFRANAVLRANVVYSLTVNHLVIVKVADMT